MHMIDSIDEVFAVLAGGGGEAYFGEPVTVLEHSLQAAWFVRRKNAEAPLVVAALLHDLGHLVHDAGEDAAARGVDTHHEDLGVEALGEHLPTSVLDPIKLHVAAKRYLCFAEPRYFGALSPASVESLPCRAGQCHALGRPKRFSRCRMPAKPSHCATRTTQPKWKGSPFPH
jgi:predicted HD phosphohydrolase